MASHSSQPKLSLSITFLVVLVVIATSVTGTLAANGAEPIATVDADATAADYFRAETRKLVDACLVDVQSWDDWVSRRDELRRQLREMLGLDPLPDRTPLKAVVTGIVEHDDFVVEKLHFQSRPHLYVTGNLFVPKGLQGRAPAVLYLCGHSPAIRDGVSYGNKTMYQHHGAWFARNGYVCLVIDTLQLGEIEGIHHGTYRENMWWWNAAGYTPAGVEAWNAIRALDYLQSRPEVDAERMGVTGRSGGGASSWWVAALDDRIRAAVPVAGITNLEDHVVQGCVEGHCDCMYPVNTYRWDFAQIAALIAPRPLLLANTDHDEIFPLDGVMDVYRRLRRLYDLAGEQDNLGLHIAAGPHEDSQVLQLHAFQWFNHHLKGDDAPLDAAAPTYFSPEQLNVFAALPSDAINARIHDTFTRLAEPPAVPATTAEWDAQRAAWLQQLREKCFRAWPDDGKGPALRLLIGERIGEMNVSLYEFESQEFVRLSLYVLVPAGASPDDVQGVVLRSFRADERLKINSAFGGPTDGGEHSALPSNLVSADRALVLFTPRSFVPSEPATLQQGTQPETHIRRRYMLLGQTYDGMRVWDTRRVIQALRSIDGLSEVPLRIEAEGDMAGIALYAALFEPNISHLTLNGLSNSHRYGPNFLNVLRVLDVPQAVAMAATQSEVRLLQTSEDRWEYPLAVADQLGWDGRIEIHSAPQ